MLRSRYLALVMLITLTLTTCSATIGQDSVSQSPTPTVYLPFLANKYPNPTIFGVDGNRNLSQIKSANVEILRLNAQLWWSEVEQTKGQYDWQKAERVQDYLKDAAANGLDVILVVQTSPEWARKYPDSLCGPIKEEEFAAFGNFLYEAVRRYSQPPYNVKYYQIWNEPDGFVTENEGVTVFGCWADPQEDYQGNYYGKMLNVVYPRIKSANLNAQVAIGSLMLICDAREETPTDYCADEAFRKSANFFEGILQEARNSFDLVMFNSGPSYLPGQNPVWSEKNNWRWKAERGGLVDGKINYLRELMTSYGVNKPIIHSEAYYLNRPDGVENFNQFEEHKADYLVWVYANGWSHQLRAVTWYSIEGWKGSELIRSDGTETKAFQALKTMTGFLKSAELLSREDNNGFTKFIFRSGGKTIWLMIPTGQEYGKTYTIGKPSNLEKVVSLFGEEQVVSGSTISFTRPVYVFLTP